MKKDVQTDRASGALLGIALGDALGMPSQTLSRAEIFRHYGDITDFVPPYPNHPVSAGLDAGQVTDDTEQTLLLAQRIIQSPDYFDPQAWAYDLLSWEQNVTLRKLHDLLGPSSKRAIETLLSGGSVQESGRYGTTNGAAMRITPVAIATPVEPLGVFVDHVEDTCRVTHNTAEAISAAAAVAAVISAGIDGASFEQALPLARAAGQIGLQRGHAYRQINMTDRIDQALELAHTTTDLNEFALAVGTSVASHQSVPAAFGIIRLSQYDPWQTAVNSANIGDDTDTIGAIATGMAAGCQGAASLPNDKVRFVVEKNALHLTNIVASLLGIRSNRAAKRLPIPETDV